jgi:hypothetical protein
LWNAGKSEKPWAPPTKPVDMSVACGICGGTLPAPWYTFIMVIARMFACVFPSKEPQQSERVISHKCSKYEKQGKSDSEIEGLRTPDLENGRIFASIRAARLLSRSGLFPRFF